MTQSSWHLADIAGSDPFPGESLENQEQWQEAAPSGLPMPQDRPDDDALTEALYSWKGWPNDMSMHMSWEHAGEPEPSTGSGKKMRGHARALLNALRQAPANPVPLYRGATEQPWGVRSWTENPQVAKQWADMGGGQVHTLEPGSAQAIRMGDYVSDPEERQWVVMHSPPGRRIAKVAFQPIPRNPGDTAHFEYHCLEDPSSADAEAWYRSHQPVTVMHRLTDVDEEDTNGPMYHVRFPDGYEHDVFNEELMDHPSQFYRPDPPPRIAKIGKVPSPDEPGWGDWWAQGIREQQPYLYHIAPREKRDEIGGRLEPHTPQLGGEESNAHGVYMEPDLENARAYWAQGDHDVWRVPQDQYRDTLAYDPKGEALYTPHGVNAERIGKVGALPTEWNMGVMYPNGYHHPYQGHWIDEPWNITHRLDMQKERTPFWVLQHDQDPNDHQILMNYPGAYHDMAEPIEGYHDVASGSIKPAGSGWIGPNGVQKFDKPEMQLHNIWAPIKTPQYDEYADETSYSPEEMAAVDAANGYGSQLWKQVDQRVRQEFPELGWQPNKPVEPFPHELRRRPIGLQGNNVIVGEPGMTHTDLIAKNHEVLGEDGMLGTMMPDHQAVEWYGGTPTPEQQQTVNNVTGTQWQHMRYAKMAFWYRTAGENVEISRSPMWGGTKIAVQDGTAYVDQLHPGLEEWAKDFGLKLVAGMTVPQYQRQIAELEQKLGPDQSPVVHQFENGWHITTPKTEKDVKRVGILMRNCWQKGNFSGSGDPHVLHDPAGIPRVVWGVAPAHMAGHPVMYRDPGVPDSYYTDRSDAPLVDPYQPVVNRGTYGVRGHGDSPAAPEHWDMIRQWAASQSPPVLQWHPTGEYEYGQQKATLGEPGPEAETPVVASWHVAEVPGGGNMLDHMRHREDLEMFNRGDTDFQPPKDNPDAEPEGPFGCPHCDYKPQTFGDFKLHMDSHQPKEEEIQDGHFPQIEDFDAPLPLRRHQPYPDTQGTIAKTADYYHFAPTVDRERMQQHGIQPSTPRFNPAWGDDPDSTLRNQPSGVYALEGYPWADDGVPPSELRSEWGYGYDPAVHDIWRIPHHDVTDAYPDPRGGENSRRIPHAIDSPQLYERGPEEYGPWPQREAGWHLAAGGSEPKDMIEGEVPFVYDIKKDHLVMGYPGTSTHDVSHPQGFSPGGIVEGYYQPGGKVVIQTASTWPFSVYHLIDLWYAQAPQMEVKSVEQTELDGSSTKLATENGQAIGPYMQALLQTEPAALTAYKALSPAGGKVYAVGGAPRDALQGKVPKDLDLMVAGLSPEEVEHILSQLPGNVTFAGKNFGVYHYHLGTSTVEIALPRTDEYAEAGRGKGKITVDHHLPIEEDLKRRDFTANSTAVNLDTGQFIDPHGGAQDIRRGVLRTTHPGSFSEDPTRLVRALTAHGRFGLIPDERTRREMVTQAHIIRHESPDALNGVMDKMMGPDNPNPAHSIRLAQETGILHHLLPEVAENWHFDQNNPHHQLPLGEHHLQVLDNISRLTEDPDVRMAALMHDVGKPASAWVDPKTGFNHYYQVNKKLPDGTVQTKGQYHESVGAKMTAARMKALNYPTARINKVQELVRRHMFPPFNDEVGARKFMNKHGEFADDLLHLREADQTGKGQTPDEVAARTSAQEMRGLVEQQRELQAPVAQSALAINGNDILGLGLKPGPAVGQVLQSLTNAVLDNPQLNSRDQLLALAQEQINSLPAEAQATA